MIIILFLYWNIKKLHWNLYYLLLKRLKILIKILDLTSRTFFFEILNLQIWKNIKKAFLIIEGHIKMRLYKNETFLIHTHNISLYEHSVGENAPDFPLFVRIFSQWTRPVLFVTKFNLTENIFVQKKKKRAKEVRTWKRW